MDTHDTRYHRKKCNYVNIFSALRREDKDCILTDYVIGWRDYTTVECFGVTKGGI